MRESLTAQITFALGSHDAADPDVFGAMLGLIAAVAHADGSLEPAEMLTIEEELLHIPIFNEQSIKALVGMIPALGASSKTGLEEWSRLLVRKTSVETRLDLLDVLLEISASDNVLSPDETALMRKIAALLELDHGAYEQIQERHRDKLSEFLHN